MSKKLLIMKKITTPKFNNSFSEIFVGTLKEAKLVTTTDISDFTTTTRFDEKLRKINNKASSNKAKHLEG